MPDKKLNDNLSNNSPILSNSLSDNELQEVKSLRWLALNFPKVENPKDDTDRLSNCINIYCSNAADLINRLQSHIEKCDRFEKIADKTIATLQAKNERLKKENKILSSNADTAFQDGLNEAQELYAEQIKSEIKAKAYNDCLAKVNAVITETYNKHIFGDNDLESEEKDAIINFSDDVTYTLDKLKKELVGGDG